MPLEIVKSSEKRIADMNMIYGIEGIGKSTWAAGAQRPLFLDVERRLGHLDVNCIFCNAAEDALQFVEEFPVRDGYASCAIDTVDALDSLFQDKVCRENHWETIEDPGYGKGYKPLAETWLRFVVALNRLREQKIEVNLVGHAEVKTFANPAGPDYQRYILAVPKSVAALLKGRCTNIFFAHYEDVAAKGKGETKAKGMSTGRRIIETGHKAAWDAKNSYDLDQILELDYNIFKNARDAWLASRGVTQPFFKVETVPAPTQPASVSAQAPTHTNASVTALLKQWMAKHDANAQQAAEKFIKPVLRGRWLVDANPEELAMIACDAGKEL